MEGTEKEVLEGKTAEDKLTKVREEKEDSTTETEDSMAETDN